MVAQAWTPVLQIHTGWKEKLLPSSTERVAFVRSFSQDPDKSLLR